MLQLLSLLPHLRIVLFQGVTSDFLFDILRLTKLLEVFLRVPVLLLFIVFFLVARSAPVVLSIALLLGLIASSRPTMSVVRVVRLPSLTFIVVVVMILLLLVVVVLLMVERLHLLLFFPVLLCWSRPLHSVPLRGAPPLIFLGSVVVTSPSPPSAPSVPSLILIVILALVLSSSASPPVLSSSPSILSPSPVLSSASVLSSPSVLASASPPTAPSASVLASSSHRVLILLVSLLILHKLALSLGHLWLIFHLVLRLVSHLLAIVRIPHVLVVVLVHSYSLFYRY
mmetsp:Transcript_4147/g.4003  ORF Transcript_4147/g.4003 Transcript_4147/m.4003 type:complete len:284 (-) Transcript_4147:9-860(-)